MGVMVRIPAALAVYSGGLREVEVADSAGTMTVAAVFDRLAAQLPALERRIRDEQGVVRRHVNVYVDGQDIRVLDGVGTSVPEGGEVAVMAAISGG
jgi:sulfur-carrier protein